MFNYTPNGTTGKIYVVTNISMNSVVFEVLLQGLYRRNFSAPLSDFTVNERYGVDSDNTAIGTTRDEIGGMYKYIVSFTDTLSLKTDPANNGNYLIGLRDPLNNGDFGLPECPAFECYWPGVQKADRIGAVILMFSTPKDNARNFVGNNTTPIYTRELMLAVNGVSTLHVLGA